MNKDKIAEVLGASQRVRLPRVPRDASDALALMENVHEQLEVGRGLGGVAADEHHGVHRDHRERVAAGVVVDQPDQPAERFGVEIGGTFLPGQGAGGGRPR